MMAKLVGVVFAGGTGTRLWPLSTTERPKQFGINIDGRTPFQNAIQALVVARCTEIVCCLSCRHLDLALGQIADIRKDDWPRIRIVAENFAVGTALVYSSIVALYPPETKMVFLPADAWFLHVDRFSAHIEQLHEELADGALMLGAPPWFRSHQLGYVVGRKVVDAWFRPTRFVQYPTVEELHALADVVGSETEQVFWNTAITIATAGFWQKLIQSTWDRESYSRVIRSWSDQCDIVLSDTSGLVERYKDRPGVDATFIQPNLSKFMLVPHHSGWCDLGTFQSLAQVYGAERKVICNGVVAGSNNRPGQASLIVASAEGLLSAPWENYKTGGVDTLRDALRQQFEKLPDDKFEARKWGYFRIIDSGEYHRVKELVIFPGCSTSMQRHSRRKETWVVKEGCLTVTKPRYPYHPSEGEFVNQPWSEGASCTLGYDEWHQLSNREDSLLRILELWHGSRMSETDIERYHETPTSQE